MYRVATLLFLSITLGWAQLSPIDLRTWTQEGELDNGNWNVSDDGFSVKQTQNGAPTFFVSPDTLINTTFHGEIRVETSSDNDYIGIVLGYESPIRANGDPDNRYKYILFDWKQADQVFDGRLAKEGWALNRVDGTFDQIGPQFWAHQSADSFVVIDSLYGNQYGWGDNTWYDVDVLYEENRIQIMIDSTVVFDTTGTFPAGRFGFYNYSQAQVRYQGFSQNQYPRAKRDLVEVPEDSSINILPLANDSDPDDNPIYITSYDSTEHGELLRLSDSLFSYTPNSDFWGADSFSYVITDSVSGSDTAVVHITVNPVNDAPGAFVLLQPQDGLMLDSLDQVIGFAWSRSADVDGDVLDYTWTLFSDSSDTSITVQDTSLAFSDTAFFDYETAYRWTVKVSDGFKQAFSDTFMLETPIATGMADERVAVLPTAYNLYPNRPNPFNPSTVILYDLKEAGEVQLAVFNVRGQKVQTLRNERQQAGRHKVTWHGRDATGQVLPSGIYFVRMQAGGFIKTHKMMLLK